jgi:hypothetical protein
MPARPLPCSVAVVVPTTLGLPGEARVAGSPGDRHRCQAFADVSMFRFTPLREQQGIFRRSVLPHINLASA